MKSPSAEVGSETPVGLSATMRRHLRILLVTPVPPSNTSSGSGQRTALMLEALETCGSVDVLHLAPGVPLRAAIPADDPNLPGGGRLVKAIAPEHALLNRYKPQPALTRAIEIALGCGLIDYDLIVGRYAWGICQLDVPTGVKLVADLDDFRYRYGAQAAWSAKTLKERMRKWMAHTLMRKQLHRFDSTFFVSSLDLEEQFRVKSVLLPNIPFEIPSQIESVSPRKKNVLFVGSLWYRPNAEGIDWFLRYVWPDVKREVPDATLMLVGAAPEAVRATWASNPGVRAPGFVDDLAQVYADTSLVVVPIHSGGGTNIKVLEALAHAKPCLVSDFTYRAFKQSLTKGEHLYVGETKEDFRRIIVKCLIDPNTSQRVALAGRSILEKEFSRDNFFEKVRNMVFEVASR